MHTSSENSWRARFRFADLAAVYIAEGGHSSTIIAARKNVECPVPQKVADAKSRDLTEIRLSAQLLVARLTTVDDFAVVFVIRPCQLRVAGTGRDGSGNRMEKDVMGWGVGGRRTGRGLGSSKCRWWPIYHIPALQCFGSHEGGSLKCPKTASGWRLFSLLSVGDETHVLFIRRHRSKLLELLVSIQIIIHIYISLYASVLLFSSLLNNGTAPRRFSLYLVNLFF